MYVVIGAAALLPAGYLWQYICVRSDMRRYAPKGRTVTVNGRKMHVSAQGAGRRVVLLAGWGCAVPSVDFKPLARALEAEGFRAVTVEKPGYGYSDDTDAPRGIDAVIDEMREALALAGEQPPYLLCGHSLAGTEVVRWANRFTDEVDGIITLDAPAPLCYTHVPTPPRALLDVQRFMRAFGIRRLMLSIRPYREHLYKFFNGYRYLSDADKDEVRALWCKNEAGAAVRGEALMLAENCRVAGGELPQGMRQLMLIASDTKEKRYGMLQPEQDEYIERNHPRVEVLEGLHNLQQFKPEEIARLIAEEWKGAEECADTSPSGC